MLTFPTTGGAVFQLTDTQVDELRREFYTKDVDKVLHEMRMKLYAGRYKYSEKGMMRAIRAWITRSPESEKRKRERTVPWEGSYWDQRIRAQDETVEVREPRGKLSDEDVAAICRQLQADLQPLVEQEKGHERKRL